MGAGNGRFDREAGGGSVYIWFDAGSDGEGYLEWLEAEYLGSTAPALLPIKGRAGVRKRRNRAELSREIGRRNNMRVLESTASTGRRCKANFWEMHNCDARMYERIYGTGAAGQIVPKRRRLRRELPCPYYPNDPGGPCSTNIAPHIGMSSDLANFDSLRASLGAPLACGVWQQARRMVVISYRPTCEMASRALITGHFRYQRHRDGYDERNFWQGDQSGWQSKDKLSARVSRETFMSFMKPGFYRGSALIDVVDWRRSFNFEATLLEFNEMVTRAYKWGTRRALDTYLSFRKTHHPRIKFAVQ
ncbi:hypothetical protein FB451DRAFT_1164769 [Mycena latifolia]|nr:hypothetical protein FB451DRAFT_1164769 [Mycena latifolia]